MADPLSKLTELIRNSASTSPAPPQQQQNLLATLLGLTPPRGAAAAAPAAAPAESPLPPPSPNGLLLPALPSTPAPAAEPQPQNEQQAQEVQPQEMQPQDEQQPPPPQQPPAESDDGEAAVSPLQSPARAPNEPVPEVAPQRDAPAQPAQQERQEQQEQQGQQFALVISGIPAAALVNGGGAPAAISFMSADNFARGRSGASPPRPAPVQLQPGDFDDFLISATANAASDHDAADAYLFGSAGPLSAPPVNTTDAQHEQQQQQEHQQQADSAARRRAKSASASPVTGVALADGSLFRLVDVDVAPDAVTMPTSTLPSNVAKVPKAKKTAAPTPSDGTEALAAAVSAPPKPATPANADSGEQLKLNKIMSSLQSLDQRMQNLDKTISTTLRTEVQRAMTEQVMTAVRSAVTDVMTKSIDAIVRSAFDDTVVRALEDSIQGALGDLKRGVQSGLDTSLASLRDSVNRASDSLRDSSEASRRVVVESAAQVMDAQKSVVVGVPAVLSATLKEQLESMPKAIASAVKAELAPLLTQAAAVGSAAAPQSAQEIAMATAEAEISGHLAKKDYENAFRTALQAEDLRQTLLVQLLKRVTISLVLPLQPKDGEPDPLSHTMVVTVMHYICDDFESEIDTRIMWVHQIIQYLVYRMHDTSRSTLKPYMRAALGRVTDNLPNLQAKSSQQEMLVELRPLTTVLGNLVRA